jgi:hypothetical protein
VAFGDGVAPADVFGLHDKPSPELIDPVHIAKRYL